jgi:hypothetical protein
MAMKTNRSPNSHQATAGLSAAPGSTPTPATASSAAKDSGLALCAEIRDTKGQPSAPPFSGTAKDKSTARYHYLRKQFAGSHFTDIRDAGVSLLDTLWLPPTPSNTDLKAYYKRLADKTIAAYDTLAAACAKHGVKLPPFAAM